MSDPRALIMALPNPVILIDAHDKISGANNPAKQMIGTDPEGLHYVTALRQPALLDAVEATLKDAQGRSARYQRTDGVRDMMWDVTVSGVTLADGRTVVLSFQDMTPLEDAGEMRRDFVANVSHELRTPLTSMMGFIETLRGPAKGDPKAHDRFLGIMEQEAGRMHLLVEDLLQLSRVEGQERIRPTAKVPLQDLVGSVLDALRPTADAKGVALRADMPDKAVKIPGDREQLWRVVSNLVENAIKYGAENGTVKIRLSGPVHEPSLLQSGIRLSVLDHGEGIAAHHIARLTERFYRVDSHRSREVGGTGLGLAIVKHIINRHRGQLRVQSVLGEGTEFTVILPASTGSAAE
ncbi:ATP-binding protein [Octadecabacter sp. G9-8]|uniref:histidine kinase n=1 Tax=Octadecabacter dasysiphoniae TaxID=2909341 RepID=A0ABS9CTX2_9RHOB|nr:ATP-binding protein [Octadecabacter dasysiphoniae]MCF2870696.1 ATP-binding protein [Octadecabacter dasysiphoniae]